MILRRQNEPGWNRRQFLLLAGSATLLLGVGACVTKTAPDAATSAAAPPVSEPQRGGSLRIAFSGSSSLLDPAIAFSYEDRNILLGVYEGLTYVDDTLQLQPRLSTSWDVADDGLSWTFQLREGVTFQHGTPFTAEDVVYTFERILNPDLGAGVRSALTFIEGIEAIDDYTVRFLLNSPNVDLPLLAGMPDTLIVPHDRTTEELAGEASGTGPFRIAEYMPGDHTTLVSNDAYWNEGIPYLDEIQHLYIPEMATQVAALTSGTIDVIWQLTSENIPLLETLPDASVEEVLGASYQPIIMQVDQAPFDDMRVRQALKYCVDRPGMMQAVLQGKGTVGNDQPITPIHPLWGDTAVREQDIEKAKQLLVEAGYPNGLELTLVTSPIRPGMVETAIAFQEMVKPAGITIEIERVPPDAYWSEYWMQVPFFLSNYPVFLSADFLLTTMYHSEGVWNESRIQDPKLDALIESARAEQDPDARRQLYAEVQQLISDEGGTIVPYFRSLFWGRRNNVHGLVYTPESLMFCHNAWLA
ncbi:MAG: ABC transporter substrate-binding protein [Caldilineaceae bacterium]